MNIGIIGCGAISSQYMVGFDKNKNDVNVLACADLDNEKSKLFAKEYNIEHLTVNNLFSNPDIDIIVNLTPPSSHFEISCESLKSGKHVFSEKPVALSIEQGKKLYGLIYKHDRYLFSAPDTTLGPAFTKSQDLILSGKIGEIIGASASFATHGVEGWHPNPSFYYKKGGGPLFDMGPYYLTALFKILGPVSEIISYSQKTFQVRSVDNPEVKYKNIDVDVDTHYLALLKFKSGVVVDFEISFDIWKPYEPKLEFYGSLSSIKFADPNNYDGDVSIFDKNSYRWEKVHSSTNDENNYYRGLGVINMVKSITENNISQDEMLLPFHVLEVMCALETYDGKGRWEKINPQF